MQKHLHICWIFCIIFSCDSPSEETTAYVPEEVDETVADNIIDQPGSIQNEVILEADASEWLLYEGTIPCADCQGITMQLKLENRSGNDENRYELSETYLGTKEGNRTFKSSGYYQITYGHGSDPTAILITLQDRNDTHRMLIQEASQDLKMLDQNGKPIDSQLNYTLRKL
ncbi:copper resistance protein NlpE [Anditalea andensis]|uniref:Copper homeostasis protein n=1 Tax=Anditalea andensis TaxID=1048983 RepID=A0A074L4S3_9BACT|nr:copper resistance protein NlpE [Anditalea andensis]KEO74858.1 hypothetical protein EL17_04045 [Anditalea andensis]